MSGEFFDYYEENISNVADMLEREIQREFYDKRPPIIKTEYIYILSKEIYNGGKSISYHYDRRKRFKNETFGSLVDMYINEQGYTIESKTDKLVKLTKAHEDHISEKEISYFTHEEYEDGSFYHNYSEDTLNVLKTAEKKIREAYIYAYNVSKLLSDDYGEECFHQCLKEDLEKFEKDGKGEDL